MQLANVVRGPNSNLCIIVTHYVNTFLFPNLPHKREERSYLYRSLQLDLLFGFDGVLLALSAVTGVVVRAVDQDGSLWLTPYKVS